MLVLLASCLAAHTLARLLAKPQTPPTPQEYEVEGLAVAASSLDLGDLWEEKEFACQLPIQNRIGSEVRIRDFIVSCGCLSVEPRSLTIPAGGTGTVSLKLDLTHRTHLEIGQAQRPVMVEVTPVRKEQRSSSPGWKLHGRINSRATLNTLVLHFGESSVQGQPPVSRKVVATVHVPTQQLEATTDPAVASVRVTRRSEDDDQFEIVVTPQPTLLPGLFKSEVTICLITPAGDRVWGAALPVAGQVEPEVRPLPARLLLGAKPIGEAVEAVVVLQAPDGSDVTVERIETDSLDVDVVPVMVEGSPPGRTFRVIQRVTGEGDQTSIARFVIRNSNRPSVTLPMEIRYRGDPNGQPQQTKSAGRLP